MDYARVGAASYDNDPAIALRGRRSWRPRGNEARTRIAYDRHRRPVVPHSTGPPAPAIRLKVNPGAVVVRQPAPGVGRDPGVPCARIEDPGAIQKRVPRRTGIPRTPHIAIGRIEKIAVIVQVSPAI